MPRVCEVRGLFQAAASIGEVLLGHTKNSPNSVSTCLRGVDARREKVDIPSWRFALPEPEY